MSDDDEYVYEEDEDEDTDDRSASKSKYAKMDMRDQGSGCGSGGNVGLAKPSRVPRWVMTAEEQVRVLWVTVAGHSAAKLAAYMAPLVPADSWADAAICKSEADAHCAVCFDSGRQLVALTPCGHSACESCWQLHVQHTPAHEHAVKCVEVDCACVVPVLALWVAVNPAAAATGAVIDTGVAESVWWQFVLQRVMQPPSVLRDHVTWLQCGNCRAALTPKPPPLSLTAGTVGLRCPACRVTQCAGCQSVPDHVPVPCKVARDWARLEALFNGVLLADSVKPCPGCAAPIEKTGGCEHVKCPKCATHFCYTCLRPWADHGSGASFYECTFTRSLAGNGAPDILGLPSVQHMLSEMLPSGALQQVLVHRAGDTRDAALSRLRTTMHNVERAKRALNLPFDVAAVDSLLGAVAEAALRADWSVAAKKSAECVAVLYGRPPAGDPVPDADVLLKFQHAFSRAARELSKARSVLANLTLFVHFNVTRELLGPHTMYLTYLVTQLHEEIEGAPAVVANVTDAATVCSYLTRCFVRAAAVNAFRKKLLQETM